QPDAPGRRDPLSPPADRRLLLVQRRPRRLVPARRHAPPHQLGAARQRVRRPARGLHSPAADHDDRGADDYCPAASAVDDVNDSRGPASLTISPQAASASSTNRLVWPAKKKPTWPPEYHSMRGRS